MLPIRFRSESDLEPSMAAMPSATSLGHQSSAHAGAVADMFSNESAHAKPAADWICVAAARNILVVDDNDRHLDILNTILSSVGHDVETCGSGSEAIRRLDMRHFDVVVLDLVMPEVSGFTVATQMRAGLLNRRTPIIICTANISIARRQLSEISGISSVIGKPIDTANLILAVARAPVRERKSDRQIRI